MTAKSQSDVMEQELAIVIDEPVEEDGFSVGKIFSNSLSQDEKNGFTILGLIGILSSVVLMSVYLKIKKGR